MKGLKLMTFMYEGIGAAVSGTQPACPRESSAETHLSASDGNPSMLVGHC